MKKNFTTEEGIKILNEIKLRMNYDLSKTLSENTQLLVEQKGSQKFDYPSCIQGLSGPVYDAKVSYKGKQWYLVGIKGGTGLAPLPYFTQPGYPVAYKAFDYMFFPDGTYWEKNGYGENFKNPWLSKNYRCIAGLGGELMSYNGKEYQTVQLNYNPTEDRAGPTVSNLKKLEQQKRIQDADPLGLKKMEKEEKLEKRLKQINSMHYPFDKNAIQNPEYKGPRFGTPEYWEKQDIETQLRGGFGLSGDLWDTPKPQPPSIDGQYVDKEGGVHKVKWIYTRYENKQPKTYTFEDWSNAAATKSKEYMKYYEQYESDLNKWNYDTNYIGHFINDPHFRNNVLSFAVFLIPGGQAIAPFLSAAIQTYDAGLYYKEKDYYSAGLSLIFALIPGLGLGKKSIPRLAKFLQGGEVVLTAEEKAAMETIKAEGRNVLKQTLIKSFKNNLSTVLRKMGMLNVLKFLIWAGNKLPIISFFARTGIEVGGIMFTYTALYKKLSVIASKPNKTPEEQKFLADSKVAVESHKELILQKAEEAATTTTDEELATSTKILEDVMEKNKNKQPVAKTLTQNDLKDDFDESTMFAPIPNTEVLNTTNTSDTTKNVKNVEIK